MSSWLLVAAALAGVVILIGAVCYYARALYAGSTFLLLGPEDADRAALLSGALDTVVPRMLRRAPGGAPGLAWHYFDSGAIVDVAGHLVFPRPGHDAVGWERMLWLLRRQRPRRPIDGVIVAVPAPLFLDAAWMTHAHDLGAAVRDRLVQAQRHFGFAVPVYVVITQCEAVRGFTPFARALPPALQQNMIGWSNPRGANQPYTGEWIAEGFASLHRSLVLAQVELFAAPRGADDAANVLMLSRDVTRLMPPLRALLDEVFRPGLYQDSYFLRGFYLSGEAAPGLLITSGASVDAGATLLTRPATAPAFTGDLLEHKIFPERGLATPLPPAARAGRRRVLIAQVALAVMAVVLVAGTVWSYVRVQRMRAAYVDVLTLGSQLLEQRQELRRNERRLSDGERLAQSRRFLERLQTLDDRRLGSVFMPASYVQSLDARVSRLVSTVFANVVLGDFRDSLASKSTAWLAAAEAAAADPETPPNPVLKDDLRYQALERFAADYQGIVDNVRRYEQLARGQGSVDLASSSDLLAYLGGGGPLASTTLSPVIGRAVANVRADPLDCRLFAASDGGDSLVGRRAAALMDAFGTRSFGDDNPVVAASLAFEDDWNAVQQGAHDQESLLDLMDQTSALSVAVTAWAPIGTRSNALALPVFEAPPFRALSDDRLCAGLRPDLSPPIARIIALRDELSDRLLARAVEPFGALVRADAKGLALEDGVASLKIDFDNLQREAFWAPPPPEWSGVLAGNPAWRTDVFDDVVKVADAYDLYRLRAFNTLAVPERQELLAPVLSQVSRLVSTRLVLTATNGAGPSADAAGRLEQITALGVQLGKAARLVPLLVEEPRYGADVLRALDLQAARALQDLDRIASTRYPAVFAGQPGDVFITRAELLTGVPAADAAKRWAVLIDDQRAGIQDLARVAQPLVQYSVQRQPTELARRWAAVAADVASLEAKRADSGFAALEATLRDRVPALVPETNCSPSAAGAPPVRPVGFFASVQQQIVDEGVRRCWTLVENRYAAIAASFNQLLAGKAPFSRALSGAADATPEQVAEFLGVFDREGGRALRQVAESRVCSADVVGFLRQTDTAAAMLATMRALTPPVLALDVLPEFRIAPERGVGADQIAQWQMTVGALTVQEGAAAKPLPWVSGDPVAVTVRFARDSPSRPMSAVPAARVQERSVYFEFSGRWALLQLLRAGRSASLDLLRVADAAPTVLGFQIPVERDPATPPLAGPEPVSPFSAFMRIRVYQPGKQEPLPVDEFPVSAPARLSCPGLS